jgi:hypothetical protein
LQAANCILHLEFQTTPESDPPLPLRMLDYWVRLHRQYRCPITQLAVPLLEDLGEVLLDFSQAEDLITWLAARGM